LLLALDALRLVGQVNGLLLGLAREGVTLAGQFRHLLGQGIALGLDHFTSGGQLGGFTLGLYQAPLDLGAAWAAARSISAAMAAVNAWGNSGAAAAATGGPRARRSDACERYSGLPVPKRSRIARDGGLLPFADQRISGGGDLLKRDAFSCHVRPFRIPYHIKRINIQI
jgi:hypothetical protein